MKQKKSRPITIRVPEETLQAIEQLTAERGRSRNRLLNEAIRKGLNLDAEGEEHSLDQRVKWLEERFHRFSEWVIRGESPSEKNHKGR